LHISRLGMARSIQQALLPQGFAARAGRRFSCKM
jgi:hypothetical protein